MNHDNYDRTMLRALESIADSLEKIESYLRPQTVLHISDEEVARIIERLNNNVEVLVENTKGSEQARWLRGM